MPTLMEFWDRPATQVESNIGAMNARADNALNGALSTVDALKDFELPRDNLSPSNFVLPEISIPSAVTPTGPRADLFGSINGWTDPGFQDLTSDVGLSPDLANLPTAFNPTVGDPQFPTAPGAISTAGEPTKPSVGAVPVPAARAFTLPTAPTLDDLYLPTFAPLNLPAFTAVAPEFTAAVPNSGLIWTEPTYESELLDELRDRVRAMLTGSNSMPAALQQALFDAARGREEMTALAAKQEAFDDFAGRNFSMPPGVLVRVVDAANERSQMASNALSRDMLTKAAAWDNENLRIAITEGVALEGLLLAKFNNLAARTFDAAKYQLEIEVKLLDSAIAVFNASQSAYATKATVYRATLEGELARLQELRAQVDLELARGTRNDQRVRLYLGELEGVQKTIELTNAELKGAEIRAGINRTLVENYGTEVQAWGQLLTARKAPLEAYEATMRGEAVRVSALEAQTRGFAETVRAAEAQANVKIKFVDAKIAAIRASTEKYMATLQAERERVQSELGVIQAKSAGYSSEVNRYSVELQGANQARAQEIQISEMRLRNDLAYWDTTLREYDAALARQLERAKIIVDALRAAGQVGGALASGAMSAIHVQAGMSGSASISDSSSMNTTISRKGADVA